MISKDSKSHPCKNPIETILHKPLQIRTNKHRCFVFCIGHTSLTCVPGIGKKNKDLLNQSGIDDLTTLYSKYRSINNRRDFTEWLENEIGFTSYQAKMTTCGIGSKLGEIKEINTGLTTICCPIKERREEKNINKKNRNIQSETEEIREKRKTLSPSSNRGQTDGVLYSPFSKEQTRENGKSFGQPEKKESGISTSINNLKEDTSSQKDYLTGVKSPDGQILARKPPNMNEVYQSQNDSLTSPNKRSSDQNDEPNKILKTSPKKFDSSSIMNKTKPVNTELLESTKQKSSSSEKDIASSLHELSKLNSTPNKEPKQSSTNSELNVSPSEQSKMNKSLDDNHKASFNTLSTVLSQSSVGSKPDDDKDQSEKSSSITPQHLSADTVNGTRDRSISNKVDFKDKVKIDDNHFEFNEPTGKETHPLFSSHVSTKVTDNNKPEEEHISKEKVPATNLTQSSHPAKNLDKEQKSSMNPPLNRKDDLSSVDIDNLITTNSPASNAIPVEFINDQSAPIPSLNDETIKDNPIIDEKFNEIFTSAKKKFQPTLDAIQDENDEIFSASKNMPNLFTRNEFPRKSILRSAQSKSVAQLNTDVLLVAIKHHHQTQNILNETRELPEEDWNQTPVNYGIDSGLNPKSNELSPDTRNDRSISSMKRSYVSLPISTPAVFPTKPKSINKSDISNSIKPTLEDNLTPKTNLLDPKLNTTNLTSSSSDSPSIEKQNYKEQEELSSRPINDANTQKEMTSPFSDKPTKTTLNAPNSIAENKSKEFISNRFDPSFTESQQKKFYEQVRKSISQISKEAVPNAKEDSQSAHMNSMPSTITNLTGASSIQKSTIETKNHDDKVQSKALSPKQSDENRSTPSKSIPLAERLAQTRIKKLSALVESDNKDVGPLPESEQQDPMQKNLFSLSKPSSTNTTSSNLSDQFENNEKNTKENPNENSPSTHVQPDTRSNIPNNITKPNNLSSIAHPIDKVTDNLILSSNTEHKSDEIPSPSIINSLTNQIIMPQQDWSKSTQSIKNDADFISSTTVQNYVKSSSSLRNSTLREQFDTSNDPYDKSDEQSNNDRLQQTQSISMSNFETPSKSTGKVPGNISPTLSVSELDLSSLTLASKGISQKPLSTRKSSESMNVKPFNEKISQSTLSSISDSKQSIDQINSSTSKTLSNSNYIKPLEEETNLNINKDFQQSSSISANLSKTKDLDRTSTDTNYNQEEQSDNHQSKRNSNKKGSEYQSLSSPSSPIPCNALWDNISNEKMLSLYKKQSNQSKNSYCRNLFTEKTILPEPNPSDYNQNSHSSATLFTFITRQQYLKELQALDEHVLYVKRSKTLYK